MPFGAIARTGTTAGKTPAGGPAIEPHKPLCDPDRPPQPRMAPNPQPHPQNAPQARTAPPGVIGLLSGQDNEGHRTALGSVAWTRSFYSPVPSRRMGNYASPPRPALPSGKPPGMPGPGIASPFAAAVPLGRLMPASPCQTPKTTTPIGVFIAGAEVCGWCRASFASVAPTESLSCCAVAIGALPHPNSKSPWFAFLSKSRSPVSDPYVVCP